MALTSNCDALVRINESAFNNIIREIMLQRPTLFNYATKPLIASNTFCSEISMNPVLASMNIPKVTEVDPLPIFGAPDGTPGVNYCMQIKELKIDFHPGNSIALPAELHLLGSQEIALKGTVCAGIGCRRLARVVEKPEVNIAKTASFKGLQFNDFMTIHLHCFCLSFYAKVRIVQDNEFLKLMVTGIEIQDIAPLGLENSIECYLKQVLDLGVLPKMKIALSDLVYNSEPYFIVSLEPVSPQIPFNPDVSSDNLSVFVKLN